MIFIQIFIITTKLKRKTEIEVDDMTSNMISTKKFKPIVSELFTGGRTVKNSLIVAIKSHFVVPNSARLNSKIHFIMKSSIKREFQY